jgi:hypothetical protein
VACPARHDVERLPSTQEHRDVAVPQAVSDEAGERGALRCLVEPIREPLRMDEAAVLTDKRQTVVVEFAL